MAKVGLHRWFKDKVNKDYSIKDLSNVTGFTPYELLDFHLWEDKLDRLREGDAQYSKSQRDIFQCDVCREYFDEENDINNNGCCSDCQEDIDESYKETQNEKAQMEVIENGNKQ